MLIVVLDSWHHLFEFFVVEEVVGHIYCHFEAFDFASITFSRALLSNKKGIVLINWHFLFLCDVYEFDSSLKLQRIFCDCPFAFSIVNLQLEVETISWIHNIIRKNTLCCTCSMVV